MIKVVQYVSVAFSIKFKHVKFIEVNILKWKPSLHVGVSSCCHIPEILFSLRNDGWRDSP